MLCFSQPLIIMQKYNEIKIIITKEEKGGRHRNQLREQKWERVWDDDLMELHRVSNLTFRERQKRCDGITLSRIDKRASDFRFRQILEFLTYACSIENPRLEIRVHVAFKTSSIRVPSHTRYVNFNYTTSIRPTL